MQPDLLPCEGAGRMVDIAGAQLQPGGTFRTSYECPECGRTLEAEVRREQPSQRIRVRAHTRRNDQ